MKKLILVFLTFLMSHLCFAGAGTQFKLINASDTLIFSVVRDHVNYGYVANPKNIGQQWQRDAPKGEAFFMQVGKGGTAGTDGYLIVEIKEKSTQDIKGHCLMYVSASYNGAGNHLAKWECTTDLVAIDVMFGSTKYIVLVNFSGEAYKL
ncbi:MULTISPECIES: hypothetical protein [Cysteiniphilum]|uniref:hypothetical protein n=1 Tax=Cysteiniphilum TaxID=2056696 RepID=UPI0017859EF6|nr:MULTISPECIES: hypothetical protein [Cysteiniphilum]